MAAESLIPNQEPRGWIEPENPEYAITKGIIKKLSKDIAAARKKLKTKQQQGKGKCKLIIAESSNEEEELAATALDIIEYAVANNVPMET